MTGLWLVGTGLIRLSRRMVIAFAGRCSFCNKAAGTVFSLAGAIGRPDLVCNECIQICLDILGDDTIVTTRHGASRPANSLKSDDPFEPSDSEIEELLRHAERSRSDAELLSQLEQIRGLLAGTRGTGPKARHQETLACSFCDRNQHETQKLIAGPGTFICDGCVADAAALISIHS
jgi:hypothetical protein